MNSLKEPKARMRSYRRPFARPLEAAWGTWSIREGGLVRLEDPETGRSGFGEIAPLPGPAADSGGRPGNPDPCRAFALWSARTGLKEAARLPPPARSAGLLSLGEETAVAVAGLRERGIRTFKLKVGLAKPETEWKRLQQLATALQPGESIRLDPNRSWNDADWHFWKPRLNGIAEWLEFIEEPFSARLTLPDWLRRAERSPVPLALDESLTGDGVRPCISWIEAQWRGYWVIKPSLMGNPEEWLPLLSGYRGKVVVSSAFETGIGLSALIRIAAAFPDTDHGLGTQEFFADTWGVAGDGAFLTALTLDEQEALWNQLPGN